MKRHRNDEVCVSDEVGPSPPHPPGGGMGHMSGAGVFEAKHQPFAGGRVGECRTRSIEMRVTAGAGTPQRLFSQVKVKGKAAGMTLGQRHELKRWPAVCTQACSVGHGRVTIDAVGWYKLSNTWPKVACRRLGMAMRFMTFPFLFSLCYADRRDYFLENSATGEDIEHVAASGF